MRRMSPPHVRPIKVLFVCLGNICRSPLAEGAMRAAAATSSDGRCPSGFGDFGLVVRANSTP